MDNYTYKYRHILNYYLLSSILLSTIATLTKYVREFILPKRRKIYLQAINDKTLTINFFHKRKKNNG